jgi:hypothetical protein
MALAPQAAYFRGHDGTGDVLLVDTLESSRATLKLGGQAVTVELVSGFPVNGQAGLTMRMARPATFALRIRVPAWASPLVVKGSGAEATAERGWASLPAREWKDGERVTLKFTVAPRLVRGQHGNAGKAAVCWGPFVLALDQQENKSLPAPSALGLVELQPPITLKAERPLSFEAKVVGRKGSTPVWATLTTFADVGASGGVYRVWLRAPGVPGAEGESLLSDGEESRSRRGNRDGSILDGDLASFVVTFDGRPAKEDWYAVTLSSPVAIGRIVFAHGQNFHDGGWFDASAGKPQVQAKRAGNAKWETVGTLADYPATTAADGRALRPGQTFTLRLTEPLTAVAVRVVGKPACGDNPKQAFSSCAELQAMKQ